VHDTRAGLRLNAPCQVMDMQGQAIPGLDCGGASAGGFHQHGLGRCTAHGGHCRHLRGGGTINHLHSKSALSSRSHAQLPRVAAFPGDHDPLNDLTRAQRRNRLRAVAHLLEDGVRIGATFRGGAHEAARGPAEVERLANNRRRA
jgi:hypothetical protein